MADDLYLVDTGVTCDGRAVFELTRPYVCRVLLHGLRMRISVPVGTRTDYASIPRIFVRLYSPTGPWRKAAVVHDYLYSSQSNCPRFLADAIFRHLMEDSGCKLCSRVPIYYAVRIFGWIAYKACTEPDLALTQAP